MERINYIIGVIIFVILSAAAIADEKKVRNLSEQDLVVASTILAEARGEGRGGMYAVAAVISQRALKRKISPAKVCLERRQFSCWNNIPRKNFYTYLFSEKEADYAINLAHFVNLGYKQKKNHIDRKKYKYADHYFNPNRANPSWKNKAIVKYNIGKHTFMRLKKNPVK